MGMDQQDFERSMSETWFRLAEKNLATTSAQQSCKDTLHEKKKGESSSKYSYQAVMCSPAESCQFFWEEREGRKIRWWPNQNHHVEGAKCLFLRNVSVNQEKAENCHGIMQTEECSNWRAGETLVERIGTFHPPTHHQHAPGGPLNTINHWEASKHCLGKLTRCARQKLLCLAKWGCILSLLLQLWIQLPTLWSWLSATRLLWNSTLQAWLSGSRELMKTTSGWPRPSVLLATTAKKNFAFLTTQHCSRGASKSRLLSFEPCKAAVLGESGGILGLSPNLKVLQRK